MLESGQEYPSSGNRRSGVVSPWLGCHIRILNPEFSETSWIANILRRSLRHRPVRNVRSMGLGSPPDPKGTNQAQPRWSHRVENWRSGSGLHQIAPHGQMEREIA